MERLTTRFKDGKAFILPSIASLTTGMQKVISKLANYEDAEEQGLLLRLPEEMSSLDKRHINLAILKAVNLCSYGVDVDDRLTTATELSCALHDAYLRGRQHEIDRMKVVEQEIRNKAIDEFAEWILPFVDGYHFKSKEEILEEFKEQIAEQMKGG